MKMPGEKPLSKEMKMSGPYRNTLSVRASRSARPRPALSAKLRLADRKSSACAIASDTALQLRAHLSGFDA